MIICSVDLALSTTGICIYDISLNKVIKYDKISTKYGIISKSDNQKKILYIIDKIISVSMQYKVSTIVVEDQFIGNITSKKTSILLSRIRGALEYAALSQNIEVDSVPCTAIKKTIRKIANIEKLPDSKEAVALAVLSIFKDDEYVQSIGPYSDRQAKDKTSDIYDSIALSVVYGDKR